jgi:carboxymethylenebutenolidase
MSHQVSLKTSDGHELTVYVAEPSQTPRAGIVVVQEIFGVNNHIRSVADDFAAQGYLAAAPAIFDRVEKGVELDYSPASIQRGRELAQQVAGQPALTDVEAAMRWLDEQTGAKPGVVGYCFGGTLAWLAATRLEAAAAVGYYGGQIAAYAEEEPKCPVLLHFGERDQHISAADVDKVRRAHPEITIHTYPAGHGFNCTERADFHDESARLARTRTLAFLAEHLRG